MFRFNFVTLFLSENVMKRAFVCGGRGVFWIYVYRVPLKLKEKKRKLKDLTLHRILYFKVLEFSFKDGGRIFYLFFSEQYGSGKALRNLSWSKTTQAMCCIWWVDLFVICYMFHPLFIKQKSSKHSFSRGFVRPF